MLSRFKYWLFNKALKRAERVIHRIRTGEPEQVQERSDNAKVIGALLLGLVSGWTQYRGPKPGKRSSTIAPTRALVPASQTPQAVLAGTENRKQSLAVKKRFSWSPRVIFGLLRDTFKEFGTDKAPQLSAALAYYTIFSLAPLMIIVIAIAGLVFGHEAAQNQIVGQVGGLIGTDGAKFIQSMIEGASKPTEGVIATVLSVITLLFGAIGVVGQLKGALNTIWNVAPAPAPGGIKGILYWIRQNLLSFGLVLGIGFLLLVSLVMSAGLAAVGNMYSSMIPGWAFEIINFVVSFVVITFLFAAIYKVLPDVYIAWRDVIIGAAFTSLLFTIGKWALGLYLGRSGVTSTYGAAGSLVLILLWIYYSAQILFLGAELTQVYANQYGSHITSAAERRAAAAGEVPTPTADKSAGKSKGRAA